MLMIRENAAHSLQLPCSRGPEGDKRTTEGDGRGLFRHGLSSVFALPFPARPEAVSLLSPFCDEVTTVSVFSGEDSHHMDNLRQEKVQRFEEFVDKRLKPDLVHAIAQRDKVFEQQKIFADLGKNIENLEKNSVTSLRTLVNLGSEVYLQAEVPDTQHIFVDVGFGFHVEFTWSEALNYIEKREEKIARQIEEYTQLIASIKAQIKLVCEGIRELLQLPAEKSLPERIF
ncbi:Protein UXT like [Glycine soja]|uniref:Protein UXT like n=1 Tax=Glycine soja TaxID=3848 RepID=A0A0B2P2S8_GLYSO|nr:Protein UXT like [Glycine soja]